MRVWLPWTAAAAVALVARTGWANGFEAHLIPVALLLLATPKLAGDAVRARRLRMETLEARVGLAEQETLRRVAEERLRIAREVHDVVGHGLATITLRAGVADRLADRDPAEVRAALRAIRQVSKESLAELQRAARRAARRGRGGGRARAGARPARAAAAGRRTARRGHGRRAPGRCRRGPVVPEVVAAAGYRIVQEALTNVRATPARDARARVRLARRDGVVEVEVRDDGRGAVDPVRPGGGLTGMRERAAALGGRFEAGGAPSGGFRVWASLPVAPR